MGIFDDELDRMKKVEICALIPIIRKTLDFISYRLDAFPECVCEDTSIISIMKKNGYEVTYDEFKDYATPVDMYYNFLSQDFNYLLQSTDKNYNYSFMTLKDPNFILNKSDINNIEYLSTTLKFSRVEIIIIDGYPYINPIGNNILLMKHYPDEGIPDFIKFYGKPTIVLLDNTTPDKIRVRDDCIFVKYQNGYNLDNVVKEEFISDGQSYKNYLYQYDTESMQGFPNDGLKFTLKTNYACTIQDIYSKTIGWGITPI